jgi:hypothetical protein
MEPQISCPHCKTDIKLTESLAAPLLQKTRADFQQKLDEQTTAMMKREEELRLRQSQLAHAQATVETQVSERLNIERTTLMAQEAKRARSVLEFEMQEKETRLKELQDTLKSREAKLVEAQKQQAEFLQKERALEDKTRELDLTIEKRTAENAAAIRAKARADSDEAARLKLAEKEETIAAMARKMEELQRRAEQGSQQSQGEVLELDFEQQLALRFPHDVIEPVPKGEIGADLLQRVVSPAGQAVGTIIWELKRTKNWSDGWLAKLRDDQRTVNADLAIIVSAALPKNVETFDLVDQVHICHPRVSLPLVTMLRQSLIELARTKAQQVGQTTKMEQMYAYLTGPQFRHRIEAIVEKFGDLQDDLNKERNMMLRQWAKREKQLQSVLESTSGMYGDLQGIAGKAMAEIESLSLPAINHEAHVAETS